jgi:hypothetical protein
MTLGRMGGAANETYDLRILRQRLDAMLLVVVSGRSHYPPNQEDIRTLELAPVR